MKKKEVSMNKIFKTKEGNFAVEIPAGWVIKPAGDIYISKDKGKSWDMLICMPPDEKKEIKQQIRNSEAASLIGLKVTTG